MANKLSWEEYQRQFPPPFDLSVFVGKPISKYPPDYDERRKANMKWHAEFIRNHANYIDPMMMLNPYVCGGWYFYLDGRKEYIPNPNPKPQVDWAAEAAAGRAVIGPAVPASGKPYVGPGVLPADKTGEARRESRKTLWARVKAEYLARTGKRNKGT